MLGRLPDAARGESSVADSLQSPDERSIKGPAGDRINALLAATGYNFGLLLRWLATILRALIMALNQTDPITRVA